MAIIMRAVPPKLVPGDVLEFRLLPGRVAYLQDLGPHDGFRLARFLPGIHRPLDKQQLDEIVAAPALYIANSQTLTHLRAGVARIIGRWPIPEGESESPPMVLLRDLSERPMIVRSADGRELLVEQFSRLYPESIVDHLIDSDDRPEPNVVRARFLAGWSPANHVPLDLSSEDCSPRQQTRSVRSVVTHFSEFVDGESALSFARAVDDDALVINVPEHDQDGLWMVTVSYSGEFNAALDDRLRAETDRYHGLYGDSDA